MGKTFVEDERPCDLCVNVTRYGCVSWNCEYINRDEAIKAWREKREMADRKTEPQNYCDDCLYRDTCDSKEFFYACTSKATISKMEQVDKPQKYPCDTCANKGDHDGECSNCVSDSETIMWKTPSHYKPKDEPQTERSE